MTAPLSDKLRPTSIDDMVGQLQLLGKLLWQKFWPIKLIKNYLN